MRQRPAQSGLDHEFAAQEQALVGHTALRADPLCLPFGFAEHAHSPGCLLAPIRDPAVPVPGPHFPKDFLIGFERLAGIGDLDGLVRSDFSGVPEIPFVFSKQFPRRGGQDFVSRLALPLFIALDFPEQSWRGRINPERVPSVIALQVRHGQSAAQRRLHEQHDQAGHDIQASRARHILLVHSLDRGLSCGHRTTSRSQWKAFALSLKLREGWEKAVNRDASRRSAIIVRSAMENAGREG